MLNGERNEVDVQLTELLERTWADVQGVGLPEHVQPAAVTAGFNYLVVHAARQQPSARREARPEGAQEAAPDDVDPARFFQQLVANSGLDPELVDELFHIGGDGSPALNLPARLLGATGRDQMKTVGCLLVGAEQLGMNRTETATRAVRAECRRLGCLDEKNFNTAMTDLEGITYTGPRAAKILKLRRAGIDAFVSTAQRVVNGV
jgi:hypothetical protein